MSVEFGTRSLEDVLIALRAENWANRLGQPGTEEYEYAKTCLLNAFHPPVPEWELGVRKNGRRVFETALKYLRTNIPPFREL